MYSKVIQFIYVYIYTHVYLYIHTRILFLFFFKFVYLFLAVLGLCCCLRAFSSCGERGLLFVAVHGLLVAVASLVAERGL